MRLFVAAELPQELLDTLSETSARLRASVRGRYVGPDLYHVTLAFLGEVPAVQTEDIARLVEEGCLPNASFNTTLAELGTFGRASSAVLWQGFDEGHDAWCKLAQYVRRALLDGGYTFDGKGFKPHVTLMRRADVARGELPMPRVARGTIDTVTLFSSDLSRERPRYDALTRVRLQQEASFVQS